MIINLSDAYIYYEVYGEGESIILLHGNGENHKIFSELISILKNKYKVYAVDSRCHGKSQNTSKITYDLMAQDMIEFIVKLNIEKPILYGFSDGGIIGLLISIKSPNLLSKLIISGANITPDAIGKVYMMLSKIFYFFTRSKIIKMSIDEPNINISDLEKITIPTYLLVGSKDVIKYEHTKLIADNIKYSTLRIVEGENHSSYVLDNKKLYEIIKEYL